MKIVNFYGQEIPEHGLAEISREFCRAGIPTAALDRIDTRTSRATMVSLENELIKKTHLVLCSTGGKTASEKLLHCLCSHLVICLAPESTLETSLEKLNDLLEYAKVRRLTNTALLGVLFAENDTPSKLCRRLQGNLKEIFGNYLFNTVLTREPAAADWRALATELEKRMAPEVFPKSQIFEKTSLDQAPEPSRSSNECR